MGNALAIIAIVVSVMAILFTITDVDLSKVETLLTQLNQSINTTINITTSEFIRNGTDANITQLHMYGEDNEQRLVRIEDTMTTAKSPLSIGTTAIGSATAISSTGLIDVRHLDKREGMTGMVDYTTATYLGLTRSSATYNTSVATNWMVAFNLGLTDSGVYYDGADPVHYWSLLTGTVGEALTAGSKSSNVGTVWDPTIGGVGRLPDTTVDSIGYYLGGVQYSDYLGVLGYDNGYYKGIQCDVTLQGEWNSTYCVYSDNPMMHIETAGNITGDYFCGLGGDCVDIDNFQGNMHGYNGTDWIEVNGTDQGVLRVVFSWTGIS